MGNFCSECGGTLSSEWKVCPSCGTHIPQTKVPVGDPNPQAEKPQPTDTETPPPAVGAPLLQRLEYHWNQASGQTQCPGCQRSTGAPGALCPHCGSRFPSPRAGLVGLGVGALGALFLLVSYLATGGLLETNRREGMSTIEGLGWVTLLIGGATFVYSVGRAGPQRQSSCCGCSCAVAALVVPTTALVLYSAGGPGLAAVLVPAWVAFIWTVDAALVVGSLARRVFVELTRSVRQT